MYDANVVSSPISPCSISLPDGRRLTDGLAVVIERDGVTEIRVTGLSQPGALVNAHFGRGTRHFVIALADGRGGTAELITTQWAQSGQRFCRFHAQLEARGVTSAM